MGMLSGAFARLQSVATALDKSRAEVARKHVERAGFIVLLVTFISTHMLHVRASRCERERERGGGRVREGESEGREYSYVRPRRWMPFPVHMRCRLV